jgi:hypothetical protein
MIGFAGRRALAVVVAGCSVAVVVAGTGAASPRSALDDKCSRPAITGTAQEGESLTAHPGDCNFSGPYSYSFLWLRCDKNGDGCNELSGATGPTYKVRPADVDHTMRVRVTSARGSHSAAATSDHTAVVASKEANAPKNTSQPTIAGDTQQGETLTVSSGAWSGATPINFAFRWQRCDTGGNNCSYIIGANDQTYRLSSADVGNTLRGEVTAKNNAGSATATSAATAVIRAPGPPSPGGVVQIGDVSLPNRLVISGILYTPNPLRTRDPFTARFKVSESIRGLPVQGAEVRVIGIPYRRIAPAGVVTTDSQGFATFTLQPTVLMPLVRGAVIVVYVQATKPGQSVIGGVSATRLTQVTIQP